MLIFNQQNMSKYFHTLVIAFRNSIQKYHLYRNSIHTS